MTGQLLICFDSSWPGAKSRVDLLLRAAGKAKAPAIELDSVAYDFSLLENWKYGPKDFFYAATPFSSHELERELFFRNVTSFYSTLNLPNMLVKSTTEQNVALSAAGIPMPKTVMEGTDNPKLLKKYVEFLGGFPMVLKIKGGSRGVGVIKVDSWQGLTSLAEYLVDQGESFVLSQYIENRGTIRSVVLGDEVLCHVMRANPQNEFRCSSPKRKHIEEIVHPHQRLNEIAIAASKAVNFEFVGVDIVQDSKGNYYVLELNYPHDFVSPQEFTGIDIAEFAVKYLIKKARARNSG